MNIRTIKLRTCSRHLMKARLAVSADDCLQAWSGTGPIAASISVELASPLESCFLCRDEVTRVAQ